MSRPTTDLERLSRRVDPDEALLNLLVCPKCRGPLANRPAQDALDCLACCLWFPIEDGIPVMMGDSAQTLKV